MKTLVAIRTNKWAEDEKRLLERLSHGPHDVTVVFHDRPPAVRPPLPVVDLTQEWVQSNGLRAVDDWGWRYGDYAYYALRSAKPDYDFYWLVEPDVHFTRPAVEFFSLFSDIKTDALGHDLSRFNSSRFAKGLPDIARHRAIFALTRFSGRALDRLFELRRSYSAEDRPSKVYANDELFTFSNAVAESGLTTGRLEDTAPSWFEDDGFRTDPDILVDGLEDDAPGAGKVFHPVRDKAGFKVAVAKRLSDKAWVLTKIKRSLPSLSVEDLEDIGAHAARRIRRSLFARWNAATSDAATGSGIKAPRKVEDTIAQSGASGGCADIARPAALDEQLARLHRGEPVRSAQLQLVHARVNEIPVTFCVNFEKDPVQRHHRKGIFYEMQELSALRSVFPAGGVFVDIGANVGNHTLFAVQHLRAGRVIPIEPNPLAYELLIENVLVNGLENSVELSLLGIGVSDRNDGGYAMQQRSRNLGAARMMAGQGDLKVYRGDEVLKGTDPDLIKIDVEGMEVEVLRSLSGLFERCRPVLFAEVELDNEAAFAEWTEAAGYRVVGTYQRYKTNRNHIVVDKSIAAETQQRLAA